MKKKLFKITAVILFLGFIIFCMLITNDKTKGIEVKAEESVSSTCVDGHDWVTITDESGKAVEMRQDYAEDVIYTSDLEYEAELDNNGICKYHSKPYNQQFFTDDTHGLRLGDDVSWKDPVQVHKTNIAVTKSYSRKGVVQYCRKCNETRIVTQ